MDNFVALVVGVPLIIVFIFIVAAILHWSYKIIAAIIDFLGPFFIDFFSYFKLFLTRLDEIREKVEYSDNYETVSYVCMEGEGSFKPRLGDNFWMRYAVHADVIDREMFKTKQPLDEPGKEEFFVAVNDVIQEIIQEYYVVFGSSGNKIPEFHELENYTAYLGRKEELKLKQVAMGAVNSRIKRELDFMQSFGLDVKLFIEREFRKEGVLVPEVVGDGFNKINTHLTAKIKGESSSISIEELEKIKQKFTGQFRFQSERQIEKLKLATAYINELINFERSKASAEYVEQTKKLDLVKMAVEFKELEVKIKELEAREAEAKVMKRDALRELSDASTASPLSAGLTEDLKDMSTIQLVKKRDELQEDVRKGKISQQEADRTINAIDNELSKR